MPAETETLDIQTSLQLAVARANAIVEELGCSFTEALQIAYIERIG
jgi:hypothetical protein